MIIVNNLEMKYGDTQVLFGVSFEAKEKTIFGLLGPSGAGKTTIINILTRQLNPTAGTYLINAKPLEIGLMLDADGLYPRLTCYENLAVFQAIYGISKTKINEVLSKVGLLVFAKKSPNTLSKGQRQRLAIARAILHSPKVLFLDEPTSGLDPLTASGIHKLIMELKENNTTIFLTTHNMEEAVRLCDTVALLDKGKIAEIGNPIELCNKYNAKREINDLEKVFFIVTGDQLNESN